MLTREERVRALLGNLKNWSWDVTPQFRIEQEDAEALREYIKSLEEEKYILTQRIYDLEGKMYIKE